MRRILFGIILVGLVASFGYCQEAKEQPLKLTIKLDEEVYAPGDEITIYCKVENVSDKEVSFYEDAYPEYNLTVKSLEGEILPIHHSTAQREPKLPPPIITLKPKEYFDYFIKGGITEGRHKVLDERKSYKLDIHWKEAEGVFLSAQGGSFHLEDGLGKYNIETHYTITHPIEWLEALREAPRDLPEIENEWKGILTSNTLTIEVVEEE
ncbi:hypothetical protein ACFL2Y_01045 [Candidatus Omnitrophota bacterium]